MAVAGDFFSSDEKRVLLLPVPSVPHSLGLLEPLQSCACRTWSLFSQLGIEIWVRWGYLEPSNVKSEPSSRAS